MNRRNSIKSFIVGSLSTSVVLSACENNVKNVPKVKAKNSKEGKTSQEEERDKLLHEKTFFLPSEMAYIKILCDIIIPADSVYPGASETGTPEFIEFIAKDMPDYQTPLRGGLRWLDIQAEKKFSKSFGDLNKEHRNVLIDKIAFPETAAVEDTQGVYFFNLMRNLVTTGYFTSKEGIKYLGYVGNTPNVWNGVPETVLKEMSLAYDEKMLSECIKNEDRGKMMVWDD